jgi:ferric-dicitrate binding protein FerR (iron transport regulator)
MDVHSSERQRNVLRREAQAWLLRLMSGQVTSGDTEAFKQWCGLSRDHAQAFVEARALWEALGPAAQAVQRRAQPAAPHARSLDARQRSRRAFLGGAIAATAACVVAVRSPFGMWPGWSDLVADYRTGTGEQRQVKVASGVTVEMNTQTAINLRSLGNGMTGMELVSGEAQVITDSQLMGRFTVLAGGGTVSASASTQCNIRCTGPQAQVICVNGRTRVDYQGRSALIQPDQLLSYGGQRIDEPVAIDPEMATAWRRNVLIFDNQPLADVVEEINRYRPGKLVLMNDALAARKVQARFSLAQLPDVAALIHSVYGAHVTALPGGIVLLT